MGGMKALTAETMDRVRETLTNATLEEVVNYNKESVARSRERYGFPRYAMPLSFYGAEDGEAPGGFVQRSDAIDTVSGTGVTVDGQPLDEIWNDLQARLAAFNRTASALIGMFTFPVTRAADQVAVYWTPDFEEATEFGRPAKIRTQRVNRGYPLKHYDIGFGFTQEYLDDADSNEIRAIQVQAQAGWWQLLTDVTLNALVQNANLTDSEGVVVRRLYNGDGEAPPTYKRWSHDGTHTHYLFSGGAGTFDGDDLDAMEEHILHHGYGDFGEQLVLHMNRDNMSVVRALVDFIPAETSDRPTVLDGTVVGTLGGGAPAGLRVQGYHGRWVIVENNDLPDTVLLGMATGGSFATQNPVGIRQHRNPSARGLRLIEGRSSRYPLVESVYDGYTGAGVRHRGASVVMSLTAGAYEVPTI